MKHDHSDRQGRREGPRVPGTQAAVADTAGLRVGRPRRRCSGFQYALAFDEQRDGDSVFEDKGIRLLVDRPSLPYVQGSTIDFVNCKNYPYPFLSNPLLFSYYFCRILS